MENQSEKELELLKTWMEWKKIPKDKQILYYYKLIANLENTQKQLKRTLYTTSIGTGLAGIGTGLLVGQNNEITMYVGGFLLLYGVIFGFIPLPKITKPDFKEYDEIEEQRKLIKKWYIAKKE